MSFFIFTQVVVSSDAPVTQPDFFYFFVGVQFFLKVQLQEIRLISKTKKRAFIHG